MNRKWIALLIGFCLLSWVGVIGWRLGWFQGPRLRNENFSRIAIGMTQTEVEELLGGPPGNYSRRKPTGVAVDKGPEFPEPEVPDAIRKIWHDEKHQIHIFFREGLVVYVHRGPF